MKITPKLSLDTVLQAVQDDDNKGFCIACAAEHDGVEPDARKYECEVCHLQTVYGAEELLMTMGI